MEDAIRDVCVGAGFDEAITFSFVGAHDAVLLPGLGRARKPIPLRNPLSDEFQQEKRTLEGLERYLVQLWRES